MLKTFQSSELKGTRQGSSVIVSGYGLDDRAIEVCGFNIMKLQVFLYLS
jgi:hypothetical protein